MKKIRLAYAALFWLLMLVGWVISNIKTRNK
jgi:hypothetical protein